MPNTIKILKTILLLGPNAALNNELQLLYNKADSIIIGDLYNPENCNIEVPEIERQLRRKNLQIGPHTRIDILAHGSLNNHNLELFLKKNSILDVENYFGALQKLTHYPLYINLRSCFSKYAGKAINQLKPGSVLITHAELEGHTHINNYALQESIKRFLMDPLISAEKQFILDLPEDFETSTFIKHNYDQTITSFETRNFLEHTILQEFLVSLGDKNSLHKIINTYIQQERQNFIEKFSYTEAPTLILTDKQVKNYISGRFLYVISSEISPERKNLLETLIIALKSYGFDFNYNIDETPEYNILLYSTIANNQVMFDLLLPHTDITKLMEHKYSVLEFSVEHDNIHMVNALLKKGINPNVQDSLGNTLLMTSIIEGKTFISFALLKAENIDFNIVNNDNMTVFHIAAHYNNLFIFDTLIRKTDVNTLQNLARGVIEAAHSKDIVTNLIEECIRQKNIENFIVNFSAMTRCNRDLAIDEYSYKFKRDTSSNCHHISYQPLKDSNPESKLFLDSVLLYHYSQSIQNQKSITNSLEYIKNFGELLQEGEQNHSEREKQKLSIHNNKAINFNDFFENELLNEKKSLADFPSENAFLFMSTKTSVLIFKEGEIYKLYSSDINYNHIITLKQDISFIQLKDAIQNTFATLDTQPSYTVYTLSTDLSLALIRSLQLHPEEIYSDYRLLSQGKLPFDIPTKYMCHSNMQLICKLDLRKTKFRDQDIAELVKIEKLRNVRKISLDDNNIQQLGLEYILKAATLSNLKKLKIRNNDLLQLHSDSLLTLSNNHPKLQALDLTHHQFNIASLEVLNSFSNFNERLVIDTTSQDMIHYIKQYGKYNSYLDTMNIINLYQNIDSHKIGHPLQNKILHVSTGLQVLYGVNGIMYVCTKGTNTDCLYSLSTLGYAFLARPIESAALKIAPIIINNAEQLANIRMVKYFKMGFVIKLGIEKHTLKLIKGGSGAALGIFDVINIMQSSIHLYECQTNTRTDISCTDKDFRDNIAEIGFSSVSFITGIALTTYNPVLAGIVALGLLVGYGTYNGISTLIEYKEKYDTTHAENWSIFWRTALLQSMSEDVLSLVKRTDYINHLAEQTEKNLQNMANNTIFYAFGLGRLEEKIIQENSIISCYKSNRFMAPRLQKCNVTKTSKIEEIVSSHATMNLSQKDDTNYHLSRVLPKETDQISTFCLPKKTNDLYEHSENPPGNSLFYCDNSAVIFNKERLNNANNGLISSPIGYYDLTKVKTGSITGGSILPPDFLPRLVRNIFYIKEGEYTVRGSENIMNIFILTSNKFKGTLVFAQSSTNIINTSLLQNFTITIEWKENPRSDMWPEYLDMTIKTLCMDNVCSYIDENVILGENINRNTLSLYEGSKNNQDIVYCSNKKYNFRGQEAKIIPIDTGGSILEFFPDRLYNCQDAVIWPNTNFLGDHNHYNLYIKTKNFDDIDSITNLSIQGTAIITFEDIALLKECTQIQYFKEENMVSFQIIPLHNHNTFTLNIYNYISNNTYSDFVLIDKYGSNIAFTVPDKNTIITSFILNNSFNSTNINEAKDFYSKISETGTDYKVFGTLNITELNKKVLLGSQGMDLLILDSATIYASGSNEKDFYIINNSEWDSIDIDNYAEDLAVDILHTKINCSITPMRMSNDMQLQFNFNNQTTDKTVNIKNYYNSSLYQHLILLDDKSNAFIPFEFETSLESPTTSVKLVPFYYTNTIISPNTKIGVIEGNWDEIKPYQRNNDMILVVNNKSLEFPNLYSQPDQWKNIELYIFNTTINYHPHINMTDMQQTAQSLNHNIITVSQLIKRYTIDFTYSMSIHHNQRCDGEQCNPIAKVYEKIGIIQFNNILPEDISFTTSAQDLILNHNKLNNFIILKNMLSNTTDSNIKIFEFCNLPLLSEPIIITTAHDTLLNKFKLAQDLYNNVTNILYNGTWTIGTSLTLDGCIEEQCFDYG